ncbi:MAG: ATP-binding protein [Mucilaginibacter sp.]|uniref:sensor histidine kinase n=1 Tax=Mucilaginibacter sp. TaxID=1882438 RepID=UPI0032675FE3
MGSEKTYQQLADELEVTLSELQEVRHNLEEATDIIEAIRSGEIDALVVKNGDEHQLFTLKSADQTYRIFIEQMTEGAVTLNRDMNIVYSNSRFADLVGLPLEKVTGQPFCRFVTSEFENYCPVLITKAWEKDMKGELLLMASNGYQIPVLLSLKTLDLDEGLSMSVIITDLTEQKENQRILEYKNTQLEEAQQIAQHLNANLENTVKERTRELETNIQQKSEVEIELRSGRKRLIRILETMAEGVSIVDLNGNLTYANPLAKKILGVKDGLLPDKSFYNAQWKNLRKDGTPLPDDEHPMAIAMDTGMPVYDHEIAVQQNDETKLYISVNAAPLYDENGVVTGVVGTFMDVTNRHLQQQQKDDFISIASHELKTPITSLKASLQLLTRLKNTSASAMLPKLIDQANRSMEKVSSLIEDLLDASHMNDGQLHLKKKKFTLSQLINDCCQHVRDEGIYTIVTEGDLDLSVYADAEKIEQVIVNFVNNAAKYAPKSKDIHLNVSKVKDMARVTVTDKGPGISADDVPHLFDRYYRVDSNGIKYSGLGLGLYISAEIIRKHNGEIGVDSEVGKGSTFWFMIPLR